MTGTQQMPDKIIDAEVLSPPTNGSLAHYEAPTNNLALSAVFDLDTAKKRLVELQEFVQYYMKEGEDYGTIPGTPKPTLYKSGADKLCDIYGIADQYKITNRTEDWSKNLFDYEVECTLVSKRDGRLIATGLGSCNSYEGKYRYREMKRKCPNCNKETIIKGKAEWGGGWICWNKPGKSDGCGAKFKDGDSAIEGQVVGKAENEDLPTIKNTLLKMAKKRCLGSNTPILIRTSSGISRVRMDTLFQIMNKENRKDVLVPDGAAGWSPIIAIARQEHDAMLRIDLADGSFIRCSGNHIFPTATEEKFAANIMPGDVLLRSAITLPDENTSISPEVAWVIGLYLAEGHTDRGGVKFTIHQDEEGSFVPYLEHVSKSLGCNLSASPRSKGNALDVCVRGEAFAGLMKQFVTGNDCYGKHLSKYAWRQGEAFLVNLIDGYLQGDGHKLEREGRKQDNWIIGFTGENFALADDLRCAAAICRYRLKLSRGTANCLGKEFPTYAGWISRSYPLYNGKNLEQVVSVSIQHKSSVLYDIEVGDPHLFSLPNGIVTHNSKVDAVLSATRSSGLFTQDIEDWGGIEHAEDGGSREAVQAVAAKQVAEAKHLRTVTLREREDGDFTLAGDGLSSVLVVLTENVKGQLGMKETPAGWVMPMRSAFTFEDICKKQGIALHYESPTREAFGMPQTTPPPATGAAPTPSPNVVRPLGHGKIQNVEEAEGSKGTYLRVWQDGKKFQVFDNPQLELTDGTTHSLFQILKAAKGQEAVFRVNKKGAYFNIVGVTKIGKYEWNEAGELTK